MHDSPRAAGLPTGQHVFDGTPAQSAGLSAHDVLIALDGLRVTADNLDKLLARYPPGDTSKCTRSGATN